MNLAIDIGNTNVKAAVFEEGQLVETFKTRTPGAEFLEGVLKAYPAVDTAVMVSSRLDDGELEQALKTKMKRYVRFDGTVPVPLKNLYRTPETLGCDRMAAAVGAHCIYPDADVMIADFGTAITVDVVTREGEFLGGNISPGAGMRFRALHEFTDKLPLCTLPDDAALLGVTSAGAIGGGVVNGITFEMEGYIARLSEKYGELKIIFTGGDGNYFAKRLKNPIFATYDLVVYGLNRILEYNAY